MKGVILAGGFGTRLYPSTAATNKHLLTVYALPMIEHPLHTLRETLQTEAGVEPEICIVTGVEHREKFSDYFKTVHPGMNICFREQKGAGGIAEALSLTRDFVGDDNVAVILGDNLIEGSFYDVAKNFEANPDNGANLFLKEVNSNDLSFIDKNGVKRVKHGIAELSSDGKRIIGIEEKPVNPKTNLAVIGFYLFNGKELYDVIDQTTVSARGELEITDVNNIYVRNGAANFHTVEGFWSDMGSLENRIRCSRYIGHSGRDKRIFHSLPEADKKKFPDDVKSFFDYQS